LLRVERVNSPLANPDALAYLIPTTIDEVLAALAKPARRPMTLAAARALAPSCTCECNPYRAYFVAGEQALTEALVLAQVEKPEAAQREEDLAALYVALRKLNKDQTDAFCAVCSHRCQANGCRFKVEAPSQAVAPTQAVASSVGR
jgi:hypothetical protein